MIVLENANYRKKNREAAKVITTKRLLENANYRQKNRDAAKVNKTRRLHENENCRQKHRQMAKLNTEKRLCDDALYREQNCKRAHARICQISKQSSYREYQRKLSKQQDKRAQTVRRNWNEQQKHHLPRTTPNKITGSGEADFLRPPQCSYGEPSCNIKWQKSRTYIYSM